MTGQNTNRRGMSQAVLLTLAAYVAARLIAMISSVLPPFLRLLAAVLVDIVCYGFPAMFLMQGERMPKSPEEAVAACGVYTLRPGFLGACLALGASSVFPMLLGGAMIARAMVLLGIETLETSVVYSSMWILPRLLITCLLAPVCEELFFRGWLPRLFRERSDGPHIVSAILFALAHGITPQLPLQFLMGLLLCWIAARGESLLAPIAVHVSYNTLLLLLDMAGAGTLLGTLNAVSALVMLPGLVVFLKILRSAAALKPYDSMEGKIILRMKFRSEERALAATAGILFLCAVITGAMI